MEWINSLFAKRKDKDHISKLVMIAQAEHMIDQTDINLLKEEMSYVSLQNGVREVEELRKKLPESPEERFSMVYFMVTSLMSHGALSDNKESLITKLLLALNLSRDKAQELVSFIKLNVRNGLSKEDSYSRLGYLLQTPVYS